MRTKLLTVGSVLLLGLAATASPAWAGDEDLRSVIREEIAQFQLEDKKKDDKKPDGTFKVKWSSGIRLESADKKAKLKIGGRIFLDTWAVNDDDFEAAPFNNSISDGFFIDARAIRIYFAGELYKHVEFKLQMEFEDPEEPEFKDVYIGIKNLRDCFGCGAPNIRFGHFWIPYGLEQNTSAKYWTFMEPALPTKAFTPSRRVGVMFHDRFRGDRLGYQLGAFMMGGLGGADEPFDEDGNSALSNGWAIAGRVTYAPWWDCNCACRRLHLGLSAMYIDDLDNNPAQFGYGNTNNRSIIGQGGGLIPNAAPAVGTGALGIDSVFALGGEVAWVYGPWSIQGEYFLHSVTGQGATADATFSGWYAQASYWLTGECRNYEHGVFGRVKPCCNFLDKDCCCYGGWEVAVRYSFTDLQDGGVVGGETSVLTVGVNWHLNPNARIMANFILADVDGGPQLGNAIANNGTLTAFGMRWQVDF